MIGGGREEGGEGRRKGGRELEKGRGGKRDIMSLK